MSRAMNPAELLALAKRSPEHVGAHDLDAWRALFAVGGRVEDPVGTPACAKSEAEVDGLVRFWRTFIAPHQIWFEERLDVVGASSVARDVLIRMKMSSGLESAVPAYLLYDFVETEAGPKVSRLAAHWEASRASKAMLSQGGLGVRTVLGSTLRIFRHLGLARGRAYLRGTQGGVRARGKQRALAFAEAWRAGDGTAVRAMCGEITIDDERVADAALARETRARRIELLEPRASGPTVAARLKGFGPSDGLGFFTFDEPGERLASVRLYGARG
jgi:hypothetical protein